MDVHYGDLQETLDKNPMTCIVQTPFEYRETHEIEKELAVSDVTSVINILRKHNMLEEDD